MTWPPPHHGDNNPHPPSTDTSRTFWIIFGALAAAFFAGVAIWAVQERGLSLEHLTEQRGAPTTSAAQQPTSVASKELSGVTLNATEVYAAPFGMESSRYAPRSKTPAPVATLPPGSPVTVRCAAPQPGKRLQDFATSLDPYFYRVDYPGGTGYVSAIGIVFPDDFGITVTEC